MNLTQLGWNTELQQAFDLNNQIEWVPARVTLEHKRIYRVLTVQGDLLAEITGKMRHVADGREDYPAVGDWVFVSRDTKREKQLFMAFCQDSVNFPERL